MVVTLLNHLKTLLVLEEKKNRKQKRMHLHPFYLALLIINLHIILENSTLFGSLKPSINNA